MQKKKIPAGIVNYRELQNNGYYIVDKTLIMKEFLDRGSKVTLITRPRRFGKTSNLNMMAEYFDITKDSKELFAHTRIIETEYAEEINQYPTICISFAHCKGEKISLVKNIKEQIAEAYQTYECVFEDIKLYEKSFFHAINKGLADPEDGAMLGITNALSFLMKKLEQYYHRKVMLFIDEYDTPFIEAHINGYYDEIRCDLAAMLHSALKDNDSLQYAMLTGIQRVAKENIFSDLNNLKVFTVKDKEYAEYFGFTEEETKDLLEYYGLEYNDQVKEMYDGYRMGNIDMYNPWSIINYADEGVLEPYWVNTSGNSMIRKAMEQSDSVFKEGYEDLIRQGYLDTQINMGTSFYEQSDTKNLWGLFINAGYLTIDAELRLHKYRIRIPNNEVREEFMSLTAHHLQVSDSSLADLFSALEDKNQKAFMKHYESILLQMPSYHDLQDENSYHMMMLGMCAYLQRDYEIRSNREEGKGRCDILLKTRKDYLPSFVIEFKYMKTEAYEKDPGSLSALAHEAVQQIEKQRYDHGLAGEIIHIRLAHAGKHAAMEWTEKR